MSFGPAPPGRSDSPAAAEHFPGPLAAVGLTVGAIFAVVFAMNLVVVLFGTGVSIASLGIGEVIGLGAIASFALKRIPEPHRERLGLQGFDRRFVAMLIFLLPIVVLLGELDNALRAAMPAPEIPPELQEMLDEFAGSGWIGGIQMVLVGVGIAPILEEWFFRGVLQQGLVAHLGRARGVILTAALYAVVHVGPSPSASSSLPPFFASFLLGVVFGGLRLATGSLLAPMLLSAGVSALGLALSKGGDILSIEGLSTPGGHAPLLILLPSCFAVVWALRGLIAECREAPIAIPLPGEDEESNRPALH